MQKTIVRARKLGGSLVVRIPKEIAVQEGIVEGMAVSLEVEKAKKDITRFAGVLKGKSKELDALKRQVTRDRKRNMGREIGSIR